MHATIFRGTLLVTIAAMAMPHAIKILHDLILVMSATTAAMVNTVVIGLMVTIALVIIHATGSTHVHT